MSVTAEKLDVARKHNKSSKIHIHTNLKVPYQTCFQIFFTPKFAQLIAQTKL